MAKIEYRICDRCEEKISEHSRLFARVSLPRVVKIMWVLTGIVSDRQKELCGKCSEELEVFLERKPKEETK